MGIVVSESCEGNAGTWLAWLVSSWALAKSYYSAFLAKVKPEELEGQMQESEANREEKGKQRSV